MATRELTSGPISGHLKALWVPMLVAMTLQSAYALVNLVFVGLISDRAVSGLSITIQAFFIILALGQVLGQTALADISQAYGRNEVPTARRALTTYTLMAVVLGLVMSLLAFLGADLYIGFFTDDPGVHAEGVAYFEANALTFLLQLVIIVLSVAMRASGDFITPMRIMLISVILNAALDPILMFAMDMGIAGAGWATVIAQAVACAMYITRLRARGNGDSRALSWGKPDFHRGLILRIGTRGVPAGIQFFLIFVLLGVVLAGMKPYGADWTGAAGGGFRVLQQTWLPLITLASAAAAMAGQNYGAHLIERVAEVAKTALRWALVYGAVATLAVVVGAPVLAYLAGHSDSQNAAATVYFQWSAPMLVAFAFTYIPTFMLQAMGYSVFTMVAAFVRVGLLALFTFGIAAPYDLGPESIFIATTVTSFVEGALGMWVLRRFLRSRRSSG